MRPDTVSNISFRDAARHSSKVEFSSEEFDRAVIATNAMTDLTDEQRQYVLVNCWYRLVQYAERAGFYFRWFQRMRGATLIVSAVTPVLAGISAFGQQASGSSGGIPTTISSGDALRISLLISSAVAAFLAGWLSFAKYGERWRSYRLTGEQQRQLGWDYVFLTGQFKGSTHADSFAAFVAALNDLTESALKGNIVISDDGTPSPTPDTSGIVVDGPKAAAKPGEAGDANKNAPFPGADGKVSTDVARL